LTVSQKVFCEFIKIITFIENLKLFVTIRQEGTDIFFLIVSRTQVCYPFTIIFGSNHFMPNLSGNPQ